MRSIAVGAYARMPATLRLAWLRAYGRKSTAPHPIVHRIVCGLNRRAVTDALRARGVPDLTGSGPADTRQRFHQHIVANHIAGPVDLLEFGVFEGASLRWWQGHLDPKSRIVGFDSFRGLPEQWDAAHPRGTFDLGGALSAIPGDNVELVVGRFEDTLPAFLARWTSTRPLVVHLDADLYASTVLVLALLEPLIVPSTIVLLDEFWDVRHEHRALSEFSDARSRPYKFLAVTNAQAAIRFD